MQMKQAQYKETGIGKIPVEWELKRVGDLVAINERTINKTYPHKQIEYIDITCVNKGSISNAKLIGLKKAPSRAKRIVQNNDVLLSTVRPNLKHYAFVKNAKENTVASTGFANITSKKVIPEYLYYYLTTERYTSFLTAIADAHTSTYPSFNPDIIENSYIPLPNETEQINIAKILSDLDSKIEINQQMNKTLEGMGQTLFKRWFVDFEFPNKNGKPYKSSGGEMVESELGEIPTGWRASTIGENFKTILGGTPSTGKKHYWAGGKIPWINSGKVNEFRVTVPTEYITQEALENSATKMMPKGTTIIAITGATLGQVSRIEIDACANQSVVGVIENETIPSEYIYFWIKDKIIKLISHQTGGAQQHINKNNVNALELLIPPENTIDNFRILIQPIFQKISVSCFESARLSNIRDSLLPRLMSGRIRVGAFKGVAK